MSTPVKKFVKLWRASASAVEAARKLGITARSASTRASQLRRGGMRLKRMARGRPVGT